MKTLIIATCTERASIAIANSEGIITEDKLTPGYRHSKDLIVRIEELFKTSECSKSDIDFVTVTCGPGSYTGIRVGVAIAKSLSFAWQKPLVGISSLYGFIPQKEGGFAVLVDARIAGAYYLLGDKSEELCNYSNEPAVASVDRLNIILRKVKTVVSPNIKRLETLLDNSFSWEESYPSMKALAQMGFDKYNSGYYSVDGRLDILYLRKTQAELEKNK